LSTQATAANIRQVNAEELEAAIAARDKPIVVDFFATCMFALLCDDHQLRCFDGLRMQN
jgi:hypothetical protein